MGREIRMVPPGWKHPLLEYCRPQPLYDKSYEDAATEWLEEFAAFIPTEEYRYFWDYHGNPPNKAFYRPAWKPEEATWVQAYETVSEGTPVTPAFATRQELADYLVANGDYWDQRRGDGGWPRENADKFSRMGWVPSGMVVGGKFMGAKDAPSFLTEKPAS